jgi:hypothetical protein
MEEPVTILAQNGHVASVAFAPDGQTLVSGSTDTTVKLWSFLAGGLLATLRGTGSPSPVCGCLQTAQHSRRAGLAARYCYGPCPMRDSNARWRAMEWPWAPSTSRQTVAIWRPLAISRRRGCGPQRIGESCTAWR